MTVAPRTVTMQACSAKAVAWHGKNIKPKFLIVHESTHPTRSKVGARLLVVHCASRTALAL